MSVTMKGFDRTFQTSTITRKMVPNLEGLIVGEGRSRQNLSDIKQDKERVLGRVDGMTSSERRSRQSLSDF